MAVRFRLWTVALLTLPVLFTTVTARQDIRAYSTAERTGPPDIGRCK